MIIICLHNFSQFSGEGGRGQTLCIKHKLRQLNLDHPTTFSTKSDQFNADFIQMIFQKVEVVEIFRTIQYVIIQILNV
jgi:hypothetical protein